MPHFNMYFSIIFYLDEKAIFFTYEKKKFFRGYYKIKVSIN